MKSDKKHTEQSSLMSKGLSFKIFLPQPTDLQSVLYYSSGSITAFVKSSEARRH